MNHAKERNADKLAIDIVILPPDDVMDVAIQWNQGLHSPNTENIRLNKERSLPHISLAMGCLRADQLEQARAALKSISSSHHAPELHVHRVKIVETTSNRVVSFDIADNPLLTRLHESVVDTFGSMMTQDATETELSDAPPIDVSAINWINQYIPHHCFENFWPHITIGFGETSDFFQPFSFQATRLAICHLGNYCTCTRILGDAFMKT